MRGRRAARLTAALATGACALALSGTAAAVDPPSIVVTDGVTQPVFSYAAAIRERVWIPVPGVDQNSDGVTDRVAVDIIRPQETNAGLKVPAIIDTSPYYTSVGRGNETEYLHSSSATQADKFPLYYDNYFVPRGYAFIAAQAVGTAWSTGCPLHGGPGDVAGFKAVIDWLRGRVPGYNSRTASDTPVLADWDNGKNAMFGKSYDGTFANGVASTGVEGLTTIVPISGISAWYDYSRSNGIRQNTGTHYPASLSSTITANTNATNLGVVPPSNNASCAASRSAMSLIDGDADGNINTFWDDRDYNKNVGNVHAAVFASHGLNDDNVKPDHFSKWWAGLLANNVPHKVWLTQTGHVDPFDYRRAAWVSTIHRWYDYWLQGVPNGIMDEPKAMIETAPNVFEDHADWPLPGTKPINVFLRGGATTAVAGNLGVSSGGPLATRLLADSPGQSENTMISNPTGSQTNRLVFLSQPLAAPLRLSGTPIVDTFASFNKTSANVGTLIVDYNATSFPKIARNGEGITTTSTSTCWGEAFGIDDACYFEVNKPSTNVTSWRVSKGVLDAQNRLSYFTDTPLTVGSNTELKYPTLPTDYTFAAGHQIGVILVSNYVSYSTITNTTTPTAQLTVDTQQSKVILPIVGGYSAAVASGITDSVAPELHLPADITVNATGLTTPVSYTATVTDDADPNPTINCLPASGSSFALGTTTVNCTGQDGGGNTATGSFTVTVTDTTAPTSNATLSGTPILGWLRPPTATITASDVAPGLSGIQKIEYRLDGGPFQTYSAPFVISGDGPRLLEYRAVDNNGNVEALHSLAFKVDGNAPVTTPNIAPGGTYHTALVTLDSTDGLGSGVAAIQYTVDGGGTASYDGPFYVTGDGSHTVTYRAVDLTGLIETTKTLTFTVDATPPATKATLSPAPGLDGFYGSPTTVTLAANDFSGSGIASIEYLLDSGSWTTYSGPFAVTGDGVHTVQFHATDAIGNVESVKTKSFTIDATGPVITIVAPTAGGEYPLGSSVASSFSCSDAVSGVAGCLGPSVFSTSPVGNHTFTVTATDNAGNTTSVTRTYHVYYGGFAWVGSVSAKQNKTAAVKFTLGGDRGLGILAAGSPSSRQVDCTTGAPLGALASTSGSLSYSSGTYTYSWNVGSWRGTCRQFVLTLNDGTEHTLTVHVS
jgi:X-Pro dipeptidyl-peptidase